jgi:hypothetical protein
MQRMARHQQQPARRSSSCSGSLYRVYTVSDFGIDKTKVCHANHYDGEGLDADDQGDGESCSDHDGIEDAAMMISNISRPCYDIFSLLLKAILANYVPSFHFTDKSSTPGQRNACISCIFTL